MDAREKLRRSFQPSRVRLLFVGESPPASGRFFYQRDSGLYRAMRDAFRQVDPSIHDENFLPRFQAMGCYLVDLCGRPVDDLQAKARREACSAGETRLAKMIVQLQPDAVACLLRSIEGNVERAAVRAHWNSPILRLPYPGRWRSHREAFTKLLAPSIRELLRQRVREQ
jgi:hypothetical protein